MKRQILFCIGLSVLSACADHVDPTDLVKDSNAAIEIAKKNCRPVEDFSWHAKLEGDTWSVWAGDGFYQMKIAKKDGKNSGCVVVVG